MSLGMEWLIETWVCRPEILDERQTMEVKRLLAEDPAAPAMREFFERFYQELGPLDAPLDDAVRRFTDAIMVPSGPFTLTRLRPVRSAGPTVLAAQTARATKARFRLLVALGGASDEPVVRLLYDTVDRLIRVYVIGLEGRPSVLSVPLLRTVVAVDERGRSEFRYSGSGVKWDEVQAVLHPSADGHEMDRPGAADLGDCRVTWTDTTAGRSRVTVEGPVAFGIVRVAGRDRVLSVGHGSASTEVADNPGTVAVWLCP